MKLTSTSRELHPRHAFRISRARRTEVRNVFLRLESEGIVGYGEATPVAYHVNIRDLAARAASYGIPGVIAEGMDFFDVFAKASAAIERARGGEGPTLLECKTYRYFGHYVGDPLTYRTKEESEKVRASRDPIDNFEKRVVADGKLKENDLRTVDDQVAKAIADAVRFAEASAAPDPSELTTDVYVEYPS